MELPLTRAGLNTRVMREVTATGYEALVLATELLHRVRRTDARAGLWEAADVQWWWRRPRLSDDAEKVFWVDAEGPVAGVLRPHDARRPGRAGPDRR